MLTPITANYVPDGDDWKVSVTRHDKTLTGRAPGLIAARDTADQLVEKLAPKEEDSPAATVVHLLEGDPVAFSTAYLHARHGGPAGTPTEDTGDSGQAEADSTSDKTDAAEDADTEGENAEEAEVPEQDSAAHGTDGGANASRNGSGPAGPQHTADGQDVEATDDAPEPAALS